LIPLAPGAVLRFITDAGVYLTTTETLRFDHPIILRDDATIDPAEETAPAEFVNLLDDVLACMGESTEFGASVAEFGADGRIYGCAPIFATATLTFEVPSEELIPGAVIVYAGEWACLLLGISEVGRHEVVIGAETQQHGCRLEGADLTFVDGHGRPLAAHRTLSDGATLLVDDWQLAEPSDRFPQRTDYSAFLSNITRCYRLFEGGVGERIMLLPNGDYYGFPSCPPEYRENLSSQQGTAEPTPPGAVIIKSAGDESAPSSGDSASTTLPSAATPVDAPRTATDAAAAARNVAAAVLASLVLSLAGAAALEAGARRRGRR
jgi:hypothetical protein